MSFRKLIIKEVIKECLNIDLSVAECAKFWSWRSNQYDASWLNLHIDRDILNKEVVEYFYTIL